MILDLPTESDLTDGGVEFVYMAVSDSIAILLDCADYVEALKRESEQGVGNLMRAYWDDAGRKLAVCASHLMMGTELLLKAQIVRVSPYALLRSVESWPRGAANRDAHFDEFATIDAHRLPQVVDSKRPSCLMASS
jgi:hypothetical protein